MAMISAYRKYFERHPPTHLLAAAYMGYKPPMPVITSSVPPEFATLSDMEE